MSKVDKEFKPSVWAISKSNIIYFLMFIFLAFGINAYNTLPREDFPEIITSEVFISTINPGNTPEDIERFITVPLEEAVKEVSNLVDIKSTSLENYSIITLEFDEEINIELAKQKVRDEIDSVISGEDWPTFNNVKVEPDILSMSLAEEMPILNVNIQGDYPTEQLKKYAEVLEDRIEKLDEIKEVDILGAQDEEIEVAVDIKKMTVAKVSFEDILSAIAFGNRTIAAGNIVSDGQRRTLRIIGEIENPEDLKNFVVKNEFGPVYLNDVAEINFKESEKKSYAREFSKNLVSLAVKKRSGKNLINAANKIDIIVDEVRKNEFPTDLRVVITNDMSNRIISQVDDLVNNILFGIFLVTTVLMFFLGFRNALFVGFAIPMSMFMSLMIISALGYSLNTMILFALVMGLGMLVDNGIVVVENVYRLMEKEGMSKVEAAKLGISEIAYPIIVSTATTVLAFVPLGLWPGTIGQFMIYLPITLSIVLGSSLFVAIFFNSMLVSKFMSIDEKNLSKNDLIKLSYFLSGIGLLLFVIGGTSRGFGTLFIVINIFFWLYSYYLKSIALRFRTIFLGWLEAKYEKFLRFALRGWRAFAFLFGTILLLFLTMILVGIAGPKIEFFPDNQPNQIIVYAEYPQGTDIKKTNSITKKLESEIIEVINNKKYFEENNNFMVESMLAQVGEGAGNQQNDFGSQADMPQKAKITVTMREFKYRKGFSSEDLRSDVQKKLSGKYPGLAVSVEKDENGPPAGYPVNIEITGKDYLELIRTAEEMRIFINNQKIAGIEELKIDVNKNKPSIQIEVDREKAGELGINPSQIGLVLRRSLFGEKAGIYKKDGEDYDINVRFNEDDRYDKSLLFNQNVIFKNMHNGQLVEVPIASLVKSKNIETYSAIKHRNLTRVVTLYSSIFAGYNAKEIVDQIKFQLDGFDISENIKYKFTGEIEEQDKNQDFLNTALIMALMLILLILVFQFNSIVKPLIIILSIFLSFIGVFLGLIIFDMTFVIIMTMLGIISLAGIVVNNSVVLIDYTQLLLDRKKEKLNLEKDNMLPKNEIYESIVNGGKARLRPVILTAITTILGLIPLAIGLNIDLMNLFINGDPNVYIGGDNVIFWGPLAWTVIFGLTFATFLTLIIVPVTFYLSKRLALKIRSFKLS
ncbi:MAG: efflux RND transporter permease subunit [Flavobacteriaceae bacterium]|nr:efflux RND transporter permease subunit [Flavobacteriaceae bacterium]MBL6685190.1 efflux RND transporter permease subunit [Flavobacteriaceae bacterium]